MANKRPHPVRQSEYWMRAISFAGLHRILKAVADFPNGLRASEINKLVQEKDISLTRRSSPPAPTTLYHYRNTLLHLRALKRDGQMLRVNYDDPDVCELLRQPAPANGDKSLCDAAKDLFAALVLKNEQCRHFSSIFLCPRTQVRIPFPVSGKTVSPLSGPDPVPLTPRRLFFKTAQRDAQRVLRHTQVWLRFYMACAIGHVMSWNSSTNTVNDLMVVPSCFPYCRLAYPRKESTPLYFRLYASFFLYVRPVNGRHSPFSISSRVAVKAEDNRDSCSFVRSKGYFTSGPITPS